MAADGGRSQFAVVGQGDQDLLLLRVPDLDPAQQDRARGGGLGSGETDGLILEDVPVLRDGTFFHYRAPLFSYPVFTFVKMYIFRLGILDRIPGLILSVLYAYFTFMKYAKLREIQKDTRPADVS
jgi:hypothetical protein